MTIIYFKENETKEENDIELPDMTIEELINDLETDEVDHSYFIEMLKTLDPKNKLDYKELKQCLGDDFDKIFISVDNFPRAMDQIRKSSAFLGIDYDTYVPRTCNCD